MFNNKSKNFKNNLFKSLTGSSKSLLKSISPDLNYVLGENKNFVKGKYTKIKEKNLESSIQDSFLYQSGKKLIKNSIEDLKTGNFNSRKIKSSDSFGDFDDSFGDFDDSEFDNILNMDDSDSENSELFDDDDSSNDVSFTNQEINESIVINTDMGNETVVTGMKTISNVANKNMLRGFSFINNQIISISKFMNENTLSFYENFNEGMSSLDSSIDMLNSSLENMHQSIFYKEETTNRNKLLNTSLGLEALTVGFYTKKLKNKMNELTDLGKMVFEDEFNELISNPIDKIIKTTFFKKTRLFKSLEIADTIFKSIPIALHLHLNQLRKSNNPILNKIGKIFGFNLDGKKEINTSTYKKDAVKFDGITRRAIVNVIPSLLSKIYSNITHNPDELVYDYDSGKFTSISNFKKSYESDLNKVISHKEVDNFINDYSNNKLKGSTSEKAKIIKNMMEKIKEKNNLMDAYESNSSYANVFDIENIKSNYNNINENKENEFTNFIKNKFKNKNDKKEYSESKLVSILLKPIEAGNSLLAKIFFGDINYSEFGNKMKKQGENNEVKSKGIFGVISQGFSNFFNYVGKHVYKPIAEGFSKNKQKAVSFWKENVSEPMSEHLKPIKAELMFKLKERRKSIKKLFGSFFSDSIGRPLYEIFDEKLIQPFKKATGGFKKRIGMFIAKHIKKLVSDIRNSSDKLVQKQKSEGRFVLNNEEDGKTTTVLLDEQIDENESSLISKDSSLDSEIKSKLLKDKNKDVSEIIADGINDSYELPVVEFKNSSQKIDKISSILQNEVTDMTKDAIEYNREIVKSKKYTDTVVDISNYTQKFNKAYNIANGIEVQNNEYDNKEKEINDHTTRLYDVLGNSFKIAASIVTPFSFVTKGVFKITNFINKVKNQSIKIVNSFSSAINKTSEVIKNSEKIIGEQALLFGENMGVLFRGVVKNTVPNLIRFTGKLANKTLEFSYKAVSKTLDFTLKATSTIVKGFANITGSVIRFAVNSIMKVAGKSFRLTKKPDVVLSLNGGKLDSINETTNIQYEMDKSDYNQRIKKFKLQDKENKEELAKVKKDAESNRKLNEERMKDRRKRIDSLMGLCKKALAGTTDFLFNLFKESPVGKRMSNYGNALKAKFKGTRFGSYLSSKFKKTPDEIRKNAMKVYIVGGHLDGGSGDIISGLLGSGETKGNTKGLLSAPSNNSSSIKKLSSGGKGKYSKYLKMAALGTALFAGGSLLKNKFSSNSSEKAPDPKNSVIDPITGSVMSKSDFDKKNKQVTSSFQKNIKPIQKSFMDSFKDKEINNNSKNLSGGLGGMLSQPQELSSTELITQYRKYKKEEKHSEKQMTGKFTKKERNEYHKSKSFMPKFGSEAEGKNKRPFSFGRLIKDFFKGFFTGGFFGGIFRLITGKSLFKGIKDGIKSIWDKLFGKKDKKDKNGKQGSGGSSGGSSLSRDEINGSSLSYPTNGNKEVASQSREYWEKMFKGGGNRGQMISKGHPGKSEVVSMNGKKFLKASPKDVMDVANEYLGTPYVWGGTSYSQGGFDCSGFTQEVYRRFGIQIGRTTYDQIANKGVGQIVGRSWDDLMRIGMPGDIVFTHSPSSSYPSPSHVIMYAGGGKYIHAPHTGDVIKYGNTKKNVVGILRVLAPPNSNGDKVIGKVNRDATKTGSIDRSKLPSNDLVKRKRMPQGDMDTDVKKDKNNKIYKENKFSNNNINSINIIRKSLKSINENIDSNKEIMARMNKNISELSDKYDNNRQIVRDRKDYYSGLTEEEILFIMINQQLEEIDNHTDIIAEKQQSDIDIPFENNNVKNIFINNEDSSIDPVNNFKIDMSIVKIAEGN